MSEANEELAHRLPRGGGVTTHPGQHRRSIAPGVTAFGSVSTSTLAVHFGNAPWWAATLIVVLGFFLALVQTVVPQNSGDRVKLWAQVFGHARFKRQQRSVQPTATVPPASPPTPSLSAIDTFKPATEAKRKLGHAVRARRVARKVSVAELSRQLGCSPGKIHRLERGR